MGSGCSENDQSEVHGDNNPQSSAQAANGNADTKIIHLGDNDIWEPTIHPVIGCAEFDHTSDELQHLPEQIKEIQRIKTVKTNEHVECLIVTLR